MDGTVWGIILETTIMIKNEQCNDIYIDPASHDIDVLGLNSEILK